MTEETPPPTNEPKDERRPSWTFTPFVILYIFAFALTTISHILSAVLLAVLLIATLYSTFSKKEYQAIHKNYPNYPRGDYIWNSLIHHILIPWAILLIIGGIAYTLG